MNAMAGKVNKAREAAEENRSCALTKILSLDEIGQVVQRHKTRGQTVVQAHGTFDLLHPGHLKHLEAAKQHGDILVVTVTGDKYVNKGPNRPVFSEQLRAEMLAALEIVDYVGLNQHPDAVPAILKVRPSHYIKGSDYRNPDMDITGKITEERKAVESGGGSLVFTDEITFSSTELLNRNFNIYEPHTRQYLEQMRSDSGAAGVVQAIERIADCSVLLVGDAIIDEYQYVHAMGKAAKENMIATRFQDVEQFAGGVFATANHIASFCKQVDVVTVLGSDDRHEALIRKSLKPNVNLRALYRPGAPTTRKVRFVDPNYMRKLFEVYYMDDSPLLQDMQAQLGDVIAGCIADFDVVVANDFGHGLIGPQAVKILTDKARFLSVNAQSNSANMGYNLITKYPRADFICIDMPEARLALSDKVSSVEDILAHELPARIDCSRFIITHGKHGCYAYERGEVVHAIPAITKSVVDTVGAGDAFFGIVSPMVAIGCPINVAGFIGNIAGALKVNIVGHQRSVEKVDVIKSIHALLK